MASTSEFEPFMLTVYLDQLRCNKMYYPFGDDVVVAAVGQSGATRDEFGVVNRAVATRVMKTSGGNVYPFLASDSTVFAGRVRSDDYVLLTLLAMNLDFPSSAWNNGTGKIVRVLAEAAKEATDRAFEASSAEGKSGGVGNLVDGSIVEVTAKILLRLMPDAIKTAIGVDAPDPLGNWFPQRDKCRASAWRELPGGKTTISMTGGNFKGSWDYETTVGVRA